jgi:hypothetical protein
MKVYTLLFSFFDNSFIAELKYQFKTKHSQFIMPNLENNYQYYFSFIKQNIYILIEFSKMT